MNPMTGVFRKAVAAVFLMAAVLIPVFSAAGQGKFPKSENLRVAPVEVVQVLEQPVNLSEAVLANTDNDPDSIWEVQKAVDALEAFASGDYSVTPKATRVTNLVDAPIGAKVIY
ncbi:MAG TPA: hypothetical protein DCK93_03645 [Blastocatellia bacterium]|nr:hypothetical protein [Blastocatellia bacterium]